VAVLPGACRLVAITPNPVSETALISFEVPQRSFVRLALYDIRGALVETVANRTLDAGTHLRELPAHAIPSSIYACRLEVDGSARDTRIVIVK
jgi:hypothetical protein